MPRFARILLAWLLAALLPLQGYAAAAMISCGPMHAQRAAQAGATLHHSHDADPADHQHGHHESDVHADRGTADNSPTLPDLLKFKCSACAACCTGATAPASSTPSVAAVKCHAVDHLFSDWSDHSIVLPGLERPPSAVLA